MSKKALFLAASLLALAANAPADAATHVFTFGGQGLSGKIRLTYAPNPNTGVLPGTSPNPVDPIGSYIVTGATGTFNDTNSGISGTVTGVVPSNPGSPTPDNLLAPASFGFYPIANGVDHGTFIAPGFSYDNLFYPGGSPQTASSYPFSGGIFDIYGVVFTTSTGHAFDLWSNGDIPGVGLTYGFGLTDGTDLVSYVDGIGVQAVPEPATWAMLLLGFGVVGAAARRRSATRQKVRFSFA